jgi:hypothetical protein
MEKSPQAHIVTPELTTFKIEKRAGMQAVLTEAETLGNGLGWEGKLIIVKQLLDQSYGKDYMKEGAAAKLVSLCEAEIENEKLKRDLVLRREEIISIYPEAANSPFFTNDGPSLALVKENGDKNYLVDNRRAAA